MNKLPLNLLFFTSALLLNNYLVNCKSSLTKGGPYNISKRATVDKPVVVGYIPSWAAGRSGKYKYDVEDVKADSLTHLVYAFINVASDGSLVHPANAEAAYNKMKDLKSKNSNLKIVPSIGGATFTRELSTMAASDSSLQNFARNVKSFVDKYGFDGIDIDWEYPTAAEKSKYSKMLELLRNELGTDMVIMSAVPAGSQNFGGFDASAMNKYLDLVCVMAYDFHGAGWESQTGHNAPLKSNNDLSAEGTMNLWKKHGVTAEKLVLGLTFYGRTWKLSSAGNNGVGAPTIGAGNGGPLGQGGFIGYVEFENMKEWQEKWDDSAQVPYAYAGDQWLSYDNLKSLNLKSDYACQGGYAGVMIWDLAFDSQASLLPGVYNHVMSCGGGNGTTTKPSGTTTKSSGTTTKASGTTTKPSETTTKPSGSTTKPGGTTTKPSGTTTKPSGTTTKSSGTTTKASGTTTKPSETTTKPSGSTTKPSGTTTKPNGTTTKPSGTTTKPSGTTTKASGTTTKPSETTTKPSGSTTKPSGTTTKPNGTTTKPSGTTTKSSGTTTKASGTTTKPSETTTKPSGSTTKPSGTTTKPNGTTTKPSGTTTKSSGTTTKASGTTTKPSGTTTKPSGTTTKPSGTTTKPSGTTIKPPSGTTAKPTSGTTTHGSSGTTQTSKQTTTSGSSGTTSSGGGDGACSSDPSTLCKGISEGLAAYPPDCGKYVECSIKLVRPCGPGTHFNPNIEDCDWPHNAKCKPC